MDSPLSLIVGGIPIKVYGLPSTPSPSGLVVLFMLHGRTFQTSSSTTQSWIEAILTQTETKRVEASTRGGGEEKIAKDLIIVALDHRNHGDRMVDIKKNLAWGDNNESHAVDMYAIHAGTSRDVSFLIDFLPSTLFPNDERVINEWYVFGVSLGGHSSWGLLAHEPRITLGIPVIGAPDYLTLLSHRARTSIPPIEIKSPHFPKSLISYINKNDPCHTSLENFKGKKILVLSGKDDELVGYYDGASDKFVSKLEAAGVNITAFIEEGVGHRCSDEMLKRASQFIWDQGLTV